MADFINDVQVQIPGTNFFDLSHDVKFTGDMGYLIPIGCFECLPNDRWKLSQDVLVKFQPLVSPVMHRMNVVVHNWFVPNRLLWDGWEKHISGTGTPAFPYINLDENDTQPGSLADYLGCPIFKGYSSGSPNTELPVSALPFAAYQFIYNERYRDQNMIDEVVWKCVDGDNTGNTQFNVLRKSAWMHDYFTSCLPTPQAGDPVAISPIQGFKDVKVVVNSGALPNYTLPGYAPLANVPGVTGVAADPADMVNGSIGFTQSGSADTDDAVFNAVPGLPYADTSSLETNAVTIEDWRKANMLQKFFERLMRVGRRFNEFLRGVWGVYPEDARLQQPEYISGASTPVIVSDIMSTASNVDPAGAGDGALRPIGDRGGTAMTSLIGRDGYYHCKEYGYIISILRVMPVTAYQQGIPRHFMKRDRFDWYTPDFAQLGEQPVYNYELYVDNEVDLGGTFGYLPYGSDYRMLPSRVAGQMKTTLSHWHAGRIFDEAPALNKAFIEADVTKRVFAVTDPSEHSIVMQAVHNIACIRAVSKFGIPGI